jgi:4,5-dihydroxyphthalate decarboxylase
LGKSDERLSKARRSFAQATFEFADKSMTGLPDDGSNPSLSMGCIFSDRIEALLDGRVRVPGYQLRIDLLESQRLFRSLLRDAQYDVGELSMSSHIVALAAGRRDYVGLPVFLSRSFRHSNVYVRTDRGIAGPEDLAGRTVGIIDFQQTAALWVRGILADDYGVERSTVQWVAAGLHEPVLEDRAPTNVAPGINLKRSSSTLDAMLRKGQVDAIISPIAPRSFGDPAVPVARLWRDSFAAEREWWDRTRLFPIMHLAVVRRSLWEADTTLRSKLFEAFDQARARAVDDLYGRDFPKIIVPWVSAHTAVVSDALGGDPWSYGLAPNRLTLLTMLRYARADGLVEGALEVDDLFR